LKVLHVANCSQLPTPLRIRVDKNISPWVSDGGHVSYPNSDGSYRRIIAKNRLGETGISLRRSFKGGFRYKNEAFGFNLFGPVTFKGICRIRPAVSSENRKIILYEPSVHWVPGRASYIQVTLLGPVPNKYYRVRQEWLWLSQNLVEVHPEGPRYGGYYLILDGPQADYGVGVSPVKLVNASYCLA
jgi:hypothetical protein